MSRTRWSHAVAVAAIVSGFLEDRFQVCAEVGTPLLALNLVRRGLAEVGVVDQSHREILPLLESIFLQDAAGRSRGW